MNKKKKAWRGTPLCLFWKERNKRAFENIEKVDQAVKQSFMNKFFE